MKPVLVDSGPLYAIAIGSDQFHDQAMDELARLVAASTPLLVPYPILFEAYGLILKRTRLPVARLWLSQLVDVVEYLNLAEADYDDAALLVQRYPDQPFTLFDTVPGVMSKRLSLPICTYDHHVDVMGVPVWR